MAASSYNLIKINNNIFNQTYFAQIYLYNISLGMAPFRFLQSLKPPHCSPAHYGFGYEVKADYATYGHQETREGEYTKGVYHVDLPDGRKQVVNYHVEGDSGE